MNASIEGNDVEEQNGSDDDAMDEHKGFDRVPLSASPADLMK